MPRITYRQLSLARRDLDDATITSEQLALLRAEVWEHEHWHAAVLQDLPCFSIEEAQERCDRSPWDVDELLVLPHAGYRYVGCRARLLFSR